MIFLGIDPGMSGALASITDRGGLIGVYDTPIRQRGPSREYDVPEMGGVLRVIAPPGEPSIVGIESQQAYPKQGVSSTFKTGFGYGLWVGIVAALRLELVPVTPQRWIRAFKLDSNKGGHIKLAHYLFPTADLAAKKDHGRADALLIAEYTRRVWAISTK